MHMLLLLLLMLLFGVVLRQPLLGPHVLCQGHGGDWRSKRQRV